MQQKLSNTIQNWGGNVQFQPQRIFYPTTEAEIVNFVKQNAQQKQSIRVIGSGHSWTPLCETYYNLISLDNYQGIVSIDAQNLTATVKAGSKLHLLNPQLFEHGLAMENLGDIDVQSIAGAVSTGTHGTGITLGIIPTQVIAMRLITATGEVLECSNTQNPEIFKAAQVSLGALGIISTLTLQCVPAYKLLYTAQKETVQQCLQNIDDYIKNNRNFEFYWLTNTNTVQTRFSNITELPPDSKNIFRHFNDLVLENGVFGLLNEAGKHIPKSTKTVNKIMELGLSTNVKKINWSHKVYATIRLVKFYEMEYNIPIEKFKDVFLEIKECVAKNNFKVHFPTENRFLKADDIYLSPAYQRNSAHISFHVYKGNNYYKYFDAVENICKNNQGRPHWGKMHTANAQELNNMYPMWQKFLEIRKQLDPNQLFVNGYLKQLFGLI